MLRSSRVAGGVESRPAGVADLQSWPHLRTPQCLATLQENLRQLCVFRLANESGKPWVWWDYIVRFGEECSMHDHTYNQACAEKVG